MSARITVESMAESHTQFGVHYMLDGYKAEKAPLENKDALRTLLETLPGAVGMYPICDPVVVEVGPNNKKDPGGISGVVLVAESHISVHTFPHRGFVTIDAYTCNDSIDAETLTARLVEHFKIQDADTHVIARGTRYPVENIHS